MILKMPRKAKPTNLHKLQGTYQKCRHSKSQTLEIESDAIEPPPQLSRQALEHWDVIAQQLKKAGVLSNMDVDALAIYCEHWAMWAEANQQIQKHGMLVKDPKKNNAPMVSPYLKISMQNAEIIRKMLSEFGMTPAARASLKVSSNEKEQESPMASWIKSRKKG